MGVTGGMNFKGPIGGRDTQNRNSYMNIWAQDATQRQNEKTSFHSKHDQLIEGCFWTAKLLEGSVVTEKVEDGFVNTEKYLDQEEGVCNRAWIQQRNQDPTTKETHTPCLMVVL